LQIVTVWVYDPENADPKEVQWIATEPSLVSGHTVFIIAWTIRCPSSARAVDDLQLVDRIFSCPE
jgi:hypothetical protein